MMHGQKNIKSKSVVATVEKKIGFEKYANFCKEIVRRK